MAIDGFPIYARNPYCEEHRLLGQLIEACKGRSIRSFKSRRNKEIPLAVDTKITDRTILSQIRR